MSDRTKLVGDILHAAEGEIVGRIRLQKIVYLLEQLGMGGGFRFSYHHYGPYSEDLSAVVDFAGLRKAVVEKEVKRADGGTYSVYTLPDRHDLAPERLGTLDWPVATDRIRAMKATSSVVIELAATVHWLQNKERVPDWRAELKIRKPSKATDEKIKKALDLLEALGLAA